jgi:hypothetical protein
LNIPTSFCDFRSQDLHFSGKAGVIFLVLCDLSHHVVNTVLKFPLHLLLVLFDFLDFGEQIGAAYDSLFRAGPHMAIVALG